MASTKATTVEAVDTETGEILEVEILAPDVVSHALTKYNITEAALADLTNKWKGFTIEGVEDKQGYTEAVEGYRRLKKLRTATEAKRKALKEPFLNAGKQIDAEAKRITAVIEPLENAIKAQVDVIDQKLEALRREEERRRVGLITSAGFQLSGQFYVLGPVMILTNDVMAFSEEMLEAEIGRGAQWKQAEDVRKAAEQAELEELRRLKAEQDARQRELDEREARIRAQEQAEQAQKPTPPSSQIIKEGSDPVPAHGNEVKSEAPAMAIVGRGQIGTSAPAPQAGVAPAPHPAFKAGWNQGIERIIQIFTDPKAPAMKRPEWVEYFRKEMLG